MKALESDLEKSLVSKLQDLKYEYRPDIRDRIALEQNFRKKFEALNGVHLTDAEFTRLLDEIVTPDVFSAARILRERNSFIRDDGTPLNYTLVNIKDWCKNSFEAVNQLRINTDNSHHRYDVVLLINGVPVVQIELKTIGISPRRAMEQIVEYKNDPGNGYTKTILCFLQLFIVSNRDRTFYFANNNARHFAFNAEERFLPVYEFADVNNKKVVHLDSFAETFLVKCTLGQTISRYMVLVASEQKLLMMRPYQVYAVKAIVDSIAQDCGNGYIWHTTGSGKTLTSFKASTLLKDNPDIDKCLFVVDRKDLDRQTREEFNKFQEGCVEENTNTASLVRRLLSDNYADKVIVCTIQKLGLALDENSKRNKQRKKDGKKSFKEQLEPLRNKRIALIFDECHRSQFGENHKAIKEFFPRAQLFGFTGTPIFDQNAAQQKIEDTQASMKTTEDLFQQRLHTYTITHAIEDGNVLRFHVDYYKPQGKTVPKPGEPLAKRAVIEAILAKHDAATGQRRFNALLATSSINDAIEYHSLFKTMQAEKLAAEPGFRPLSLACVFSPPADGDPDVKQIQEDLPQEKEDNAVEPEKKKEALKAILADYNAHYGTNHKISEFDLYYQDVQKRIKDQQWPDADLKKAYPNQPHHKIDITIVVDMLLTGFDSKFLNTLYVDKNLKYHGLIQAFSRTNRVLNATKPYGNILDFRQQQGSVDAAIALFSGESAAEKAREIWLVDKAPVVIQKLETAVQKLDSFMKSQGLDCAPEAVPNLKGDAARAAFIEHFKEVQRLKTQLDQYTDLTNENRQTIEQVLPHDNLLGFRGAYLETAQRLRAQQGAPSDIQLDIRKCSLNKFHSALTEDDVRDKLNRFKPEYRFEFIYYDDPQDGIQAVSFFQEVPDPDDANNVAKIAYKISRGEERIFVWCFFLALFEVDGWADQQASHFFIDDPVSSLDDHNIFITASTLFDLIEDHFEKRKIIITTHHFGFFAILADWLKKGEKADKFKKHSKVGILSAKNGVLALESPNKDVLLYHLRLLQLLEQAWAANEVRAFHFALLRQVLENVASFLGVGQFGYVLNQIGIDDPDDTARVINTLSHKKVYYFESEILEKDSRDIFDKVFLGLKDKYNFVLHAPAAAPAIEKASAQ